ncbi:MAG: YkgJ family cysteine cluster protein, partial [Thermoplasmata archaeon]|nr:YkgJ family cysteine cluster protein [Thermoplasmata archaeon]
MSMPRGSVLEIDRALLAGFTFSCRPDCGLCCFATPAVTPREKAQLIQLDPATPFEPAGQDYSLVRSRPEGGACHFLSDLKCRAYAGRPFPCRTFPVSVHLASRAQATVVLGCPGLPLDPLRSPPGHRSARGPKGLDEELSLLEAALAEDPGRGWRKQWVRNLKAMGLSEIEAADAQDPAPLQARLAQDPPMPTDADMRRVDLPSVEEGVEGFPLFWEEGTGVVAIGRRGEDWEAVSLKESGGVRAELGRFLAPDHLPRLEAGAEALLKGYLSYVARRDLSFGQVLFVLADSWTGYLG